MKRVFLLAGRLCTSDKPLQISTCLGSCVAVTIADPVAGCGGMNHFVLPQPKEDQVPTPRFASVAIPALADAVVALGGVRARLVAKVYGGAWVLPNSTMSREIGERNAEAAVSALEKLAIPIIEKDTGGNRARRITLTLPEFSVTREIAPEAESSTFDVSGYPSMPNPTHVRLVIVDDHEGIRELFRKVFERNGIEVVGVASDAVSARALIVEKRPNVVTLDVEMPGMSGIEFLEKLMQHLPTPVVMVSHLAGKGEQALRAIALGALEFVQKPTRFDHDSFTKLAETLVDKVRAAAMASLMTPARQRQESAHGSIEQPSPRRDLIPQVIALSGNTGSLDSLGALLEQWPSNCPPTVVANPSVAALLDVYLERYRKRSAATLKEAKTSQRLEPGTVYFIPSDYDGRIRKSGIELSLDLSVNSASRLSPSADLLFASAADACGQGAAGVLLSGFGRDGIDGLEKVISKGGVAIVQSPAEAPFPHVAQQAMADGVFDFSLSLKEIARWISDSVERKAA